MQQQNKNISQSRNKETWVSKILKEDPSFLCSKSIETYYFGMAYKDHTVQIRNVQFMVSSATWIAANNAELQQ